MNKTLKTFSKGCFMAMAFLFGTTACNAENPKSDNQDGDGNEPTVIDFKQPVKAQDWNENIWAGWNLGNQLECVQWPWDGESLQIGLGEDHMKAETGWGNPTITKKLIHAVKEAGFDAIRIPVRWACHIENAQAMTVNKEWMARVKEVVDMCLAEDMQVIINVHHDKWLESRPWYSTKEENNQKLALLWMNIATAFAGYDYRLAFAGTNEVHEKDKWGAPTAENLEVQNSYNQTFVDVVRSMGGNNEKRHLIVQTYVCNPSFGIDNGDFIIPTDPAEGNGNEYMSVEFHYYTPWDYAGFPSNEKNYYYWGQAYSTFGEISPSNEITMKEFMEKVYKTWAMKGLGVVIGEWGVTDRAKAGEESKIHENITYYCNYFCKLCRRLGYSTFVWDNNSFGNGMEQFGIFDRKQSNAPVKADWVIKGIMKGKK